MIMITHHINTSFDTFINPFEMVVTKKVKYIVNDLSGISTNILVRENGKLVVPGNLTLYNGASLVVHGHLLGAETLLIYDDAIVDLKGSETILCVGFRLDDCLDAAGVLIESLFWARGIQVEHAYSSADVRRRTYLLRRARRV